MYLLRIKNIFKLNINILKFKDNYNFFLLYKQTYLVETFLKYLPIMVFYIACTITNFTEERMGKTQSAHA